MRGAFGWRKRYRRLTKQGRSPKGASPGRISGLGNRACRVYQVKERLRCSIGQCPTELDAMWTPQSDGKREWLCFIERKDKSFVSNCGGFLRENVFIFRFCERKTKNTGTFSRSAPCFSHRSPLSQVAFLLWGEIGSCFLAPLGVLSVSRPSGQCALAHDALARGDAHPRLAHSASFHFFAFTHHLQPAELLLVRCEGFCISMIYSGG